MSERNNNNGFNMSVMFAIDYLGNFIEKLEHKFRILLLSSHFHAIKNIVRAVELCDKSGS